MSRVKRCPAGHEMRSSSAGLSSAATLATVTLWYCAACDHAEADFCSTTAACEPSDTAEERLALDAERRAEEAATQEERDGWLRKADYWWTAAEVRQA